MASYAAIKVSKETLVTMLANVADMPGGQERLIWAMLTYPYQKGITHYYIGGNYLNDKTGHSDYTRQILTQEELDNTFTYQLKEKKNGKPNPNTNWFVVKMKETADAH